MGFRNIVIPDNNPVNPLESESIKQIPKNERFQTIEVGRGNKTMKTDERGSWWGSEDPETAPVYIDMDGNISIRATSLTSGANIRFYDVDGNEVIFIGIEDA